MSNKQIYDYLKSNSAALPATAEDAARYTGDKFEALQERTKAKRTEIARFLNLPPGSEDWIELPEKKNPSEHAAAVELLRIKGLTIVKDILKPGEVTPLVVINNTRGIIVYTAPDGQMAIVRKPISYNVDIVMDSLTVVIDKKSRKEMEVVEFTIPLPGGLSTIIKPLVTSLSITPYVEGTIIDIMKLNGHVRWVTSRNLIPEGVKVGKDVIHHKASWMPFHEAFTDTLTNIFANVDPNMLIDNKLFPEDTLFSNRSYRFVVTTRERVRAHYDYVGKNGFATYLGCIQHWDNKNPPLSRDIIGDPHNETRIYKPKTVAVPPKDRDMPYILDNSNNLTLADANAILSGPHPERDIRFTGGGKLIITASYTTPQGKAIKTFHVESTAYAHRNTIMGNEGNLYSHFVRKMSIAGYDFTDKESLNRFCMEFPCVKLPLENTDFTLNDVKELVNEFCELPAEVHPNSAEVILANPIRHIWYNFLLCTNISVRPFVFYFIKRYITDLNYTKEWLKALTRDTVFTNFLTDKDRNFALTTWRADIQRHANYNKGNGFNIVMLSLGSKAAKMISLARKQSGTQAESIQITEPAAKFTVKTNYATICSGSAGQRV